MDPTPPDTLRNPYSPPAALVADEAVATRPMPAAVRRALFLYVISFVLGLVLQVTLQSAGDRRHAELTAVANAVSIGLMLVVGAWLFWKIGAGRNWARTVLLVLTLLSVPAAFYEIVQLAPVRPFVAGFKLIEQGLDVAIIFLLFFPGREYFRPLPR